MSDVIARAAPGFRPKVALVLGSGLGGFVEEVREVAVIPYADLPGFPQPTVGGHAGRLVLGHVGPTAVAVLQGRAHYYERGRVHEMKGTIEAMAQLGCETLLQTNAAGSLRLDMPPGSVMAISDHINFTGRNPIQGLEPDVLSDRFFSMYEPYDPGLRQIAHDAAIGLDLPIQESIYLGLAGPSFETAAEIRAFRLWGADTVAMSVCEEVIAARHMGLSVLGLSLVVNMACGVGGVNPLEDDPFQVAQDREADLCSLIQQILERI